MPGRQRAVQIAIEASTWVNPRGYGRFTRELTRALLAAGSTHEFTLVLDTGAAAASDLPDAPRQIVATRTPVVDAATATRSRSVADLWRMSAALSRFDAVLFPTLYSFVPVGRRPFVIVVAHDALPETLPKLVLGSGRARFLWWAKSTLACRRANLLATVSESSAREIRKRLPIGRTPFIVLTEGAAEVFSPARRPDDGALIAPHVPPGGRFILYVGGMSPHKRIPDLVRAFAEVARRPGNEDLQLVLAGPDERDGFTTDRLAIDAMSGKLGGLSRRVVRTGFVPDATLAALYRAARVVVLPSVLEGFGLSALEAMASGTPVIVRRTDALEELCGSAVHYFESEADLIAAITGIVHDPERGVRGRELGLARARRFAWSESARRLLVALEAQAASGGSQQR